MRQRPSARLLVIDPDGRLLLFKFAFRSGPLAGQTFWATPGGALEPGESYGEAARRELLEEVGLDIADLGPQVAQRHSRFQTPHGEWVEADERFFLIQVGEVNVSRDRWTELELEVMAEHRWWSLTDLRCTGEQIWPEGLADMLIAQGAVTEMG
ncbi:MAG: NUDIX domain-containing protein [Alphaproteobacteria bacterium]|nr:NUDIX domain-containing protein [Alphaproteobacteria bacterium]